MLTISTSTTGTQASTQPIQPAGQREAAGRASG
jgi:hypothetical protein